MGTACVVCVGGALPAGVLAIMSPLAFDRRGSLFNPIAWLAFLLMITLWIVCMAAPFAAWVSFTRGQTRLAWMLVCAPLAWVLVLSLCSLLLPG